MGSCFSDLYGQILEVLGDEEDGAVVVGRVVVHEGANFSLHARIPLAWRLVHNQEMVHLGAIRVSFLEAGNGGQPDKVVGGLCAIRDICPLPALVVVAVFKDVVFFGRG